MMGLEGNGSAFVAGFLTSAIVVGAFMLVWIFRAATLVAAASYLVWTGSQGGVPAITGLAGVASTLAFAHPEFSFGVVTGMVADLIIALAVYALRK